MTRKFESSVQILFKGFAEDGTVFDDHSEGEPFTVVIGRDMVPEGLEDALKEMEVGEERTIELPPEKGYGEYCEEGRMRIPTVQIPDFRRLPVGDYVQWYGQKHKNNAPTYAKIVSVNDLEVIIDLNHPLAGQTTKFWVKVVGEGCFAETELDAMLADLRARADAEKAAAEAEGKE